MKPFMKLQPVVLVLAACAGCTHIPPDVAAELSAPDGQRPNNYATTTGQDKAETHPGVVAP